MKILILFGPFLRGTTLQFLQKIGQTFQFLLFRLPGRQQICSNFNETAKLADFYIIALLRYQQNGEHTAKAVSHMIYQEVSLSVPAFDNSHIFQTTQRFSDGISA